jgi:hypothetical protein
MTAMNSRFLQTHTLESLLQPETTLEEKLLAAPAFRKGLLWGEPRFGHPEGIVAFHVKEVLENIALIPRLSAADRSNLRLIALATMPSNTPKIVPGQGTGTNTTEYWRDASWKYLRMNR